MDPITLTGIPTMPRPQSAGFKSAGGGGGQVNAASPEQAVLAVSKETMPDITAIDRKRAAAVQRAAQQLANVYVVSDLRFTIFKDSTGQYITRFTSLRDGKVTYIPEPSLLSQTGGGSRLLQIEA